ncbi:enhanced serine sensitivity protein SseB C-terminal domain-containing protein [Streptomyces sp. JJ38]|uniref:enhanced serine sensitivity protein SseB C-terminal domain-containing protein n=1 Tax=Streptomyces sp. JJ38 TaxID=2738128 RepID=UPI001C575CD9|nr:enhanced serine sensitivity protein SseB C-terminal domain-containing protein [Streptomyces sp. JJ38]MBW1598232.1 enhanced serine sensitivity protein SseB [Streptomyces sp. JJ38]
MSAGESVRELLRQVSPGRDDRYDRYEALLHALADAPVWPLLWDGAADDPEAHYARMDVAGHPYVPSVTSPQELHASGWARGHTSATGRDVAAALYPHRIGLWLDPHGPGGGLGVPWPDLRRIAGGLDRLAAGPLHISEPTVRAPQFYAQLTHHAQRTPAVRSLRRAWVRPAVGAAFLVIGVDVYEPGPGAAHTGLAVVRQAAGALPPGLPVSVVTMSDAHEPVAMWLHANSRPFFDRDAAVSAGAPARGYGYPHAR